MKKWLKFGLVAFFVLGTLLAVIGKGVVDGWFIETRTTAVALARLQPHINVVRPQGAGPFPTILMFHGCGGDAEQQAYWASVFRDWGYASVVVDSLGARGISRQRALSEVCTGRILMGGERAADVLLAIDWVQRQTWADATALTLAGWSHGAWSIMDLFAFDQKKTNPHGVSDPPSVNLAQVQKLILFYPYCGFGSHTQADGWRRNPEILLLTAANDQVVNTAACLDVLAQVEASGATVQSKNFANVGHAYDIHWVLAQQSDLVDAAEQDATVRSRSLIAEFLEIPEI